MRDKENTVDCINSAASAANGRFKCLQLRQGDPLQNNVQRTIQP